MKVYIRGGGIDSYGKEAALLPILHEIAPENSTLDKQGRVLLHRFYFPEGDPRIKVVGELLIEHKILDPSYRSQPNFGFWRVTHFTDEDYANARYYWVDEAENGVDLSTPENFRFLHWFSDGVARAQHGSLRLLSHRRVYASGGSCSRLLIPGGIKRELEAMNFVGLGFNMIQPVKKCTPIRPSPGTNVPMAVFQEWLDSHEVVNSEYASDDESWWILHPTIELPKQHPSVYRPTPPQPPSPQWERGPGFLRNEGMHDFHPVYTKCALDSVEPFDIARSWEFIGIRPKSYLYICSRRFMDAFKKFAKKARWLPVEERES